MRTFTKKQIILFITIVTALFLLPSLLLAGDKKEPEEVELFYEDADTAYKIIKLVSVKNEDDPDQIYDRNEGEIRQIVSKLKGDAAVYVTHVESYSNPDELTTDAVVVEYLSPKEMEKRSKKAKDPPVLEKEHPLDPEPIVIKYKDVKFPYRIVGTINMRLPHTASVYTSQAVDYKLGEIASRRGADGVIYVDYVRAGSDVSGATGILIKSEQSWEEVDRLRHARMREEALRKQKEAEKEKQEEAPADSTEENTE